MPERKPREWQIEVCPECGCDPEACVCDECDEIETVPVVEVLGPERMLAWAIDGLGEDAVAELLLDAMAEERGRDVSYTVEAEVHLALGRLVRALRGSDDGE